MRKELTKKKLMGKRKSDKHRLIYILMRKTIIIPIILSIGFLFFVYQKNQLLLSAHNIFSKVNAWVIAHKKPQKNPIKKETRVLANDHSNDIPVHFEFYSVLPAVQISGSSTNTTIQTPNNTAAAVDNALSAHIKNQKQPQKKHLVKNLSTHKET